MSRLPQARIQTGHLPHAQSCIAVLIEDFFMDSRYDLEYLQSEAVKGSIINTHTEGVIAYFYTFL